MTEYCLPQVSYRIAYQLLPHYAFEAFEKVHETWTNRPTAAGAYYYLMACQMAEVEPVREDAIRHLAEAGSLGDAHDYYLIQFPIPPSVDMSDRDPVSLMESGERIVLAPHFAVIVRDSHTGDVRYFVLGQAPIGGGTTLRTVTKEGANANLGPGPDPSKADFLATVADALR